MHPPLALGASSANRPYHAGTCLMGPLDGARPWPYPQLVRPSDKFCSMTFRRDKRHEVAEQVVGAIHEAIVRGQYGERGEGERGGKEARHVRPD